MSEALLEALMQLFALVAEVDGTNDKSRAAVRHFLEGELPSETADVYLSHYDNYIREYHFASADATKTRKQTSRNSVKVLRICTQINSQLLHYQKLMVLIRLLEYLSARTVTSKEEQEFADLVAEAFHIENSEYQKARSVVIADTPSDMKYGGILLTPPDWSLSDTDFGMLFLHFDSCHAIFVKNYGIADMFMAGLPVLQGRVHAFPRGNALSCQHCQPLYHGQVKRFFLTDEQPLEITFDVSELSFVFKAGNTGLHPFNMQVAGGQLVAIMGGSGAGKSTLLNVLNGNTQPAKGKILINGHDIYIEKAKMRGLIGFVSQDDLLLEDLTVWQNLWFNARLCFNHLSREDLKQKVEQTLKNLGLWEAAQLKVGSPLEKFISGGQRKRLNISLELIREPPVLFIDEPTSGLSSRDSQLIMDLLKDLTNRGKLIFVVIHQPSAEIFKLFDHLLLLDQGGYVVYQGKPLESIPHFKTLVGMPLPTRANQFADNARPEQLFTILEAESVNEYGIPTGQRRRRAADWYQSYRLTERKDVADAPTAQLPQALLEVPPAWRQSLIFLQRDIFSKMSNKQYVLVNLMEAPALAFIIGLFLKHAAEGETYTYFHNDNMVAYLFISVVVALFLGLSLSAEEIIKDRRIRQRESFLHLNSLSYLLSKITILFAIAAVQTALFTLVGNLFLEIQGNYLTHWWILFSAAAMSAVLGLNISASFRHVVTVYILIPFVLIPQILFSGVLVKYDALHPLFAAEGYVPWIGNIMPSRWFFEALVVDRAINNPYEQLYYQISREQYQWDFYRNYWSPEMEMLHQKALNPNDEQQKRAAQTMVHEFKRLPKGILSSEEQNVLPKTVADISSENSEMTRKVLLALNTRFRLNLSSAIEKRDAMTSSLRSTLGEDGLAELRARNHNKDLSEFLNNSNALHRINWSGNYLVRKVNYPYFEGPHYYSPARLIYNSRIGIVYYNLGLMWVVTGLLFAALHLQILPILINRRKMF